MARYAVFFTYTSDAWTRMIKSPGDRTAAVRQLADSVGGSLESAYWMFGAHDGFVVVDVPDPIRAAALSVAVGSTGAFKHLETHEFLLKTSSARCCRTLGTPRRPTSRPASRDSGSCWPHLK